MATKYKSLNLSFFPLANEIYPGLLKYSLVKGYDKKVWPYWWGMKTHVLNKKSHARRGFVVKGFEER